MSGILGGLHYNQCPHIRKKTVDKCWLSSYEQGIPSIIHPEQYPSLVMLLKESLEKFGSKPAFFSMSASLSYQALEEKSRAFAGFLQRACHLDPKERVAIMLPNLLQYPVALYGILRAGMVVVNVNPLYTARELKVILQDSGATCILLLTHFAHVLQEILSETAIQQVIVTEVGDLLGPIRGRLTNWMVRWRRRRAPAWRIPTVHRFPEACAPHYLTYFQPIALKPTDLAFLQYTGGTTKEAKGAKLTHRNMVANVMQATAWMKNIMGRNIDGSIVTALPLYHIFSMTANCLVCWSLGISNVLIANPRDIPGMVRVLRKQPFAIITGVNTLFRALLRDKGFCRLDFSRLVLTLGGGTAVQKAVALEWEKVSGVPLIEAYGLTEASPAVTMNPFDLKHFNGAIGLPIPSTEVKVVNEEGEIVGFGAVGELWVRGPQVMQGYWRRPEETKNVLTKAGWLKTGDLVTMDERGFVYWRDRKKDVIVVSGFNVYPHEIEEVISELPGVKEVAVIGVPIDGNEMVKAFIVKKDPLLNEAVVLEACRKNLARYKVPKSIVFQDALPKNALGKVLKRVLRDQEGALY